MKRRNTLTVTTRAAALLTLSSSLVASRGSTQPVARQARRCVQAAQTDDRIVACLKTEVADEESAVRVVEQRLRTAMPDTARGTFDAAARAWAAYRDAECQAVYSSYSGGRYNLMSLLSCRAALTVERRKTLQQVYRLGQ
ncbi:MAG TPA: lysozyme inhibitor LprI family protein [Gemmatirosa sp.]